MKKNRKDAKHTTDKGRTILGKNGKEEPRSAKANWKLWKAIRDLTPNELEAIFNIYQDRFNDEEYKDKEREGKKKQIIDFLARHSVDPRTDSPHTAERIASAIDEAGVNIENKPVEQQISKVIEKIKPVLPIKIKTKKLKIRIPAEHTGRVYGLITEYKESENWLSNGELEATINLPVGLQEGFYDKLNSITHGSAITQEIKEE